MKVWKFFIIAGLCALVCALSGCENLTSTVLHIHEWGEWTVIASATCSTQGKEIRVCARDSTHTMTREVPINPDAHVWGVGQWTVKTAATCTETGEETGICTFDSGHTGTRSIPIDPAAHDFGLWATKNEPDETSDGLGSSICKRDPTHIGERILYATGTEGLEYTLLGGSKYLVENGVNQSAVVYIPEYHRANAEAEYLPITSIGGDAFSGCTGLTSITIPASITSIGGSAFSGCTGLTSITIPDSITSIWGSAFSGCTGLVSVTIPDSVTYIGSFAFASCTGLTSITIPASITSIWDYAFASCTGLTSITIPDKVTSIGDYGFSGCSGLTSITIPASVTSIGYFAFASCTSLTSVTFETGSNITAAEFQYYAFPGNLKSVYLAAVPKAGTYKLIDGEWEKQ